MAIKCCHGCVPPKRHTACWDTCTEYIEEKAENDKKREEDRRRRAIIGGLYESRGRQVRKAIKHRKK